MHNMRFGLAIVLLAVASSCESSAILEEPSNGGSGGQSASGQAAGGQAAGGQASGGGPGSGPATSARFAQAIDGAMLASRSVYAEIPIQIALDGHADSVTLESGEQSIEAADPDNDGTWTATLSISGNSDETLALAASARVGRETLSAEAELVIVANGQQMSDFPVTGFVGTPRMHRIDEQLWLSFTDRQDGVAKAWLQRIDGAGRSIGDRISLVSTVEETLYARAAIAEGRVGVLYQQSGSPYANFFTVVSLDGTEIVAPIALDGQLLGSYGGDIAVDDDAFVITWRRHDGAGASELQWARIAAETGEMTGPSVVASAGPGTTQEPDSNFDPFTVLNIAAIGGNSVVSFTRNQYDTFFDLDIPKSFLATVSSAGTITELQRAGSASDNFFHWEVRTFPLSSGLLSVYAAQDLLDVLDPPPTALYAKLSDANGSFAASPGAGTIMLKEPDDRGDEVVVEHPTHGHLMAWIDHRKYTLDPSNGGLELYAAPLNADFTVGDDSIVFSHAAVSADNSYLEATTAGSNVLLSWRDARNHGFLELELWLDTVWSE